MENLLMYFAKVNGLIILFYLMYILFLRKETFFVSNRWYFLSGLILSLILPLITFTKIIWVEPTPIPEYYEEAIPITYNTIETPIQEATLDWSLILMSAYIVISILIILKIGIELVSFFKRIQKQNKQKESDYTLVDSNSAENPFSFFSYIVINKDMFTEEELQHILTHESIHVKQKHSFDVLIGKVFCAIFWVNPIIWFYRKAMLQNLEFIADNETFQQIENKYEYQKTLLKVVTHQHNLSITNQFYQSLIKKRIVMLHTNQSHKKNVWKYATILPLLVGFMLLFQIETVAQVKEVTISKSITNELIQFVIDKNTTDAQIKEETELLKKEHNIELKISKIKRNAKNEITALEAKFEDSDKTSGKISIKGEEAIEPIRFFKEINENGKGNIGFDRNNISTVFAKMDADQLEWNDAQTIEIKKSDTDEVIYIINGKEYSKEEMKDKIVELDGAIEMNENEKNGKKIMIFKGNSTISDEPKTIIYLDEKMISEDEMKRIDANIIKSVDVNKGNIKKEIKIITKNSSGLPEDAEIYIDGKKATKEELDKIEKEEIETININNNNGKKSIEIHKKNIKTISGGTWTDVNKEIKKQEIKIITTDDGDESIIFNVNKLKIPGEPTVIIENGRVDIYVNGKKLPNSESFLNIDPSKIYYLEVTDKEKTNEGITKIKRIEVKTK
ncbi:M56 family metallopeptidase [Flavobacterium cheniae]|uniref:Beta-lactamase regulating signal transducer with metallopeptidase domain n=1 Tax=Flavobacterium cheniae TaxID=295428 RepID=A0A562KJJ0_9FLAO|nr:M56 family metallopeptidase [Flavobacterium cheniae]TDR25972.1 beta-lactamase regulating signal transducer with metallopeptidase domain [Flavobacterium cheniae]TWH95578.1 beta-lactamase regulating signal transducer with metallopeptidase domain [Flavobacterium cheniae]